MGQMTARTKTRHKMDLAVDVYLNVHARRARLSLFVDPGPDSAPKRSGIQHGTGIAPRSLPVVWRSLGMKAITKAPGAQNCLSSEIQRRPRQRFARFGMSRGQSLVELALVLPILLLLLVGTIEVGRFSYYSILVSNAARAGAQYGAQSLATAADTAGIKTAAQNDANVDGLTVTAIQRCGCTGASLSGSCPATGCSLPNSPLVYVQVTATGTFNSLFSYPGLPPSITVTSTEEMRVAQ